ncbi:MAG TPA: hypothetical protein PLK06_03725, partial [bacterium]|nr:hypothetical protein [bacterium]
MERELPRRQPESDVPELETIKSQEDQEVIAGREIPLHEELGFDSIGQMEQARAMQAALLKEKDMAKADKLRAELKALLDDSDGTESAAVVEVVAPQKRVQNLPETDAKPVVKVAAIERPTKKKETTAEDAIADAEFQIGMENAARRAEISVIDDIVKEINSSRNAAEQKVARDRLAQHLDKMKSVFNQREKMQLRSKKEQIASATDELIARAEAFKSISLDSIAYTNEGLLVAEDDSDET